MYSVLQTLVQSFPLFEVHGSVVERKISTLHLLVAGRSHVVWGVPRVNFHPLRGEWHRLGVFFRLRLSSFDKLLLPTIDCRFL